MTLEAEHFADVDRIALRERKPLLWFWQMFDRSPIGLNHWLGLRFRCMLGRHIFDHMGSGVKIYHGVDLTYGYNLSIGDGVTIRQRALLNDRGGITIGKNAVIGSFSRIFSHAHDPDRLRQGDAGADHDRRRRAHRQPRHRAGRHRTCAAGEVGGHLPGRPACEPPRHHANLSFPRPCAGSARWRPWIRVLHVIAVFEFVLLIVFAELFMSAPMPGWPRGWATRPPACKAA